MRRASKHRVLASAREGRRCGVMGYLVGWFCAVTSQNFSDA
jgi:hypothetical protein